MAAPLKIGVLLLGGMGDSVQLSMYLAGIKRKWPESHITVYCKYPEVFRNNPIVNEIGHYEIPNWFSVLEQTKHMYDIYYDLRYCGHVYYNNTSTPKLQKEKKLQDEKFQKYRWFYDNFLTGNYKLTSFGKPIWQLVADSTNLECSPKDMFIDITPDENDYVKRFKYAYKINRYVTVHDFAMFGWQTKCWPMEKWTDVIKFLKDKGIAVVQLGTGYEHLMEGVISQLGRTELHQSAALIKHAELHIDIEGGLVHIAKAVGTKSLVLFGPTPEVLFAYPENMNIRSGTCAPCFWRSSAWMKNCIENRNSACMRDLEPANVILKASEHFGWYYPKKCKKTSQGVLNIGVERDGGIGDGAYMAAAIAGIKRKYPNSYITAFATPVTKMALIGRPEIDQIRDVGIRSKPEDYDLYYDVRPDGNMYINVELAEEGKRWYNVLMKYQKMKQDSSYAPNHLNKYGHAALEVINELFGLDCTVQDMQIVIPQTDREWVDKYVKAKNSKIVTIHDWAFGFRQTKCWSLPNWSVVVEWLKSKGYCVVQLGGKGEDSIPGTSDYMLGRLPLARSVALMLQSSFHVDNESSLAHYTAAFGHPAFVLVGPTMRYWWHKENYNIHAGGCMQCEGHANWPSQCVFGKKNECMRNITPDQVIKTIQQYIDIDSGMLWKDLKLKEMVVA